MNDRKNNQLKKQYEKNYGDDENDKRIKRIG